MAALFDPIHHRGKCIKWGLVSYTTVMFSLATIFTTMTLDIQSISYIDNCEFYDVYEHHGVESVISGLMGYQLSIGLEGLSIIPNAIFTLNNLLADGCQGHSAT